MTPWVLNARMYAVVPEVERGWQQLLEQVARAAGIDFTYLAYPAPQPLESLWSRDDLGLVFMCGYPIALRLAAVVPIAAPIPAAPWAQGRAVYRTDLIVRVDSPYRTLEDTFGARAGWTVAHSHSGYNAFRHHLLPYRTPARPKLFGEMHGNLITARNVLEAVRTGRIDVGPLDAYWHLLLARHAPELTAGVRVLASTELAPMPALVAAGSLAPEPVARLRAALLGAAEQSWFAPLGELLQLKGFAEVHQDSYALTLAWDRAARAAGYDQPG